MPTVSNGFRSGEGAQPRRGHVAGAVAAPLLAVEVDQVGRDLPLRALGGAPIEPGGLGHGAEKNGPGVGRQAPHD